MAREVFEILAEALCYPAPGALEKLEQQVAQMPGGKVQQAMRGFTRKIGRLSLEEWEELYTRTLDLNPAVIPYVGYQAWGESYRRGELMSQLQHEMNALGVSTRGELPDHLIPVLQTLAVSEQPLPALVEILQSALHRMRAQLRKNDAKNPYLKLFDAILDTVQDWTKECMKTIKAGEYASS